MDIAVLGSEEVVAALGLAGLPGRPVADKAGLHRVLGDSAWIGNVRIPVLEDRVAGFDRQEVDRLKLDASGPLVVEIPGITGPSPDRRSPLDLVRQALGINL